MLPPAYKLVHNRDFKLLWFNLEASRDPTFEDFCNSIVGSRCTVTIELYEYLKEQYNKLLFGY